MLDKMNRVILNIHNSFFKENITNVYRDNPFLLDASSLNTHLSINISGINSEYNSFLMKNNKMMNAVNSSTQYSHNPFLNSVITSTSAPSLNKLENSSNIFTNNMSTIMDISNRTNIRNRRNVSNIRRKSDIKCEEYNEQFLVVSEVQPLVAIDVRFFRVKNNKQCTMSDQLVSGGTIAAPGEFPHMTALGEILEDRFFKFLCGGTLISHYWVLTAAHCTRGENSGINVVRFGLHNIEDNKSGIMIHIERIIRHPLYKPPLLYADIALIKLQKAINFSSSIRPACLCQQFDEILPKAWVSGWGALEFSGEKVTKLRKAELDMISNIVCSLTYGNSVKIPDGITPGMICAGDLNSSSDIKDTCQGDSGGPLQILHPRYSCLYKVIGITSFAQVCGNSNSPGVYTRVSYYLNWIEDIVWPEKL
ncbi:PREDICTED: serine protease snake-like isoform X2 [Polistes dominula]|nr:PREDICTED: serine protease snake-like isoform X2 [Polistes dominula]